jgi:hypothetical protein
VTQVDKITDQRALRHRAQQLASLGQLPAFQVLRNEMEKQMDRLRDRLHAVLLSEDLPVAAMQRQADYNRGYADGMRYIAIAVIAGAMRKLEQPEVGPETEGEEDYWSYGQR